MAATCVTAVVRMSLDRIQTGAAWFLAPDSVRGGVRRLGDGTWRFNIGTEVFGPYASADEAIAKLSQQMLGRGWLLRPG